MAATTEPSAAAFAIAGRAALEAQRAVARRRELAERAPVEAKEAA